MGKFKYTMDKSGVIEIAKSAAVREQLGRLAADKAAEANQMLAGHGGDTSHGYMSHVHVLDRTAVALVHTTGITTELDQNQHHTLDAINH